MSDPDDAPVTVARFDGPRGSVVLRRRPGDPPVDELVVNGVFAMDSAETETERRLAGLVTADRPGRVLVGGLGLGYTAAELLEHEVGHLDVVEIEECLVGWARDGLTPTLARVAGDPRTRLWVADVAAVLAGTEGPPGSWDAILLDVDNGPGFLIHAANAGLYVEAGLRTAYARLAPGGLLAVWSDGPVAALLDTLGRLSPTAREHRWPVVRGVRELEYAVYTVRRPG